MPDINSPTQALELAARVVRGVRTILRREVWVHDGENPDIPETVTWQQEYPISRTAIRYLGETDEWAWAVEKAVREVLPRHGQTIVQSSFHETDRTFMKIVESDYVKVTIENRKAGCYD